MKRLSMGVRGCVIVFALIAVGGIAAQNDPTPVSPSSLSGSIAIAGSSTVAPLTERIVEMFEAEGYNGSVENAVIGTGAGFEHFCEDATADIANASRPIRDTEAANCRAIERNPVEFYVAVDALAVTVSAGNNFVDALTLDQLADIYSGRAVIWSDVDPEWPREPIYLFSPGTDSGTFDYFVEEVFEGDPKSILSVPGIQFSESDVVLVDNIENNRYAIGYFGYAYFYPERSRLNAVRIEGIEPNEATAESGEYPLARPLFIYSAGSVMRAKPEVAEFIRFYLENANMQLGTGVDQIRYFPVSEAIQAENMRLWRQAMNLR